MENAEINLAAQDHSETTQTSRSASLLNLIENADYDIELQRQKTHAKPIGEGHPVVIVCCFHPRTNTAAEHVLRHIHYVGRFLQVRVAGGRAINTLRSLITAHYMFQLEVVAVVHLTFCGCTPFTLPTINEALTKEDHIRVDERTLSKECLDALTIGNLNRSVTDDVKLIRERVAGQNTKVLGFVYDIVTGELIPIL